MGRLTSIAKIIAAIGAVAGAHVVLPAPYGVIVEAVVAAAAVLARSPLQAKPNA